ncbi:rac GTPase-activating protein 1 [Gadus macrocephalus]|uniref:rac GTPase-activating protein 1 n=1 Tax=Gadus macrocephalus TaxID=80720 RepID=UPI0028CB8605|nr:rac GTPase-activating protein 1 [Gadus macrocephalus]
METVGVNLHILLEPLMSQIEVLNNECIEPQFIQMALNFDECRRKWLRLEQDLGSCQEVLAKTQTERGSLEVKLKHARNQVDVEIRRRQKAEAECEKLDRQIQLIRELLISEGSSNSIQLNEEQRSALAFLNARSHAVPNMNTSRRLLTIDESASILSDISYDKTDDSLDWNSSAAPAMRLRKRQKRRSSRNQVDGPPMIAKRSRSAGRKSHRLQENESLVAKTTLTVPAGGGPVEAVSTIETVPTPYWTRSKRITETMEWDSKSVQSVEIFKQPSVPDRVTRAEPSTPQNTGSMRVHEFVSKTVIKPESCVPCGKRIKFGKISLKCRDCRVVSHPECRERCPLPCIPTVAGTPVKNGEGTLADYVSVTSPMIPPLVVHCVNEIEQRGLNETGLYRLSGAERTVRDLKDKFLRSRTVPLLSKVEDIHAITGLLKDFLRNLKEPLLTFRLNRAFMDAAEISDDDNSIAQMYQLISQLPQPNRDTLAFLAVHFQRVAQSVATRMDVSNLSRVLSPTLVGHAVANPEPMTILQDTKRQPKVVERLLALPLEYWSQFLMVENDHPTSNIQMSMLGPLTTPEHQLNKTPSSSSLKQRVKSSLTPSFGSKSKSAVGFSRPGNFFASPLLR